MEMDDIDGYLVKAQQEYIYSLETGFIDADAHPDAPLVPELVVNNGALATNVHSTLLKELAGCECFDFSVAFVSWCQARYAVLEHRRGFCELRPGRVRGARGCPDRPEEVDRFNQRERTGVSSVDSRFRW